ncbi:MAG: PEP-utilizing enzyme [archaeon]
MNKNLESLLNQKWYTQGFAARPVFIYGVPSLETMIKPLGFSYKKFLMNFKGDYCEFNYLVSDFNEHAQIILDKIALDKKYMQRQKKYYEKQLELNEKYFLRAEKDLSKLSNKEFFSLANELIIPFELTGGVAHLIEGISLRLEHDIRNFLKSEKDPKTKNSDFSILSSPVTSSFLSKKEELLWKIKNATGTKKKAFIKKFMGNYFWINSSYVQNNPITEIKVARMSEEMASFNKPTFVELKKKKMSLYKKYNLSKQQIELIELAEFLTDWQDDRKSRIYRGIYSISLICKEASKRFNIEEKLIHYILLNEYSESDFVSGKTKQLAQDRYNGVIIVREIGKFETFTGSDFIEFENLFHKKSEEIEGIHGVAANLGTATGPVRVCKTLESVEKVQKGDVLVASMTRPEYISAMKKAVAIVTDEGGITCHAAIVSRELKIPCIVGTKIATKVLKDGWIVEVKANHGQVVVLEKK